MTWLMNRLREASTWRGLVWLLTVSGVALRPDQVEAIVLAGMAIAGLLGVFLQDKVRDPNERTRETDIPEIELVGVSESTIQARPQNAASPVFDGSVDEHLARMYRTELLARRAAKNPEQSIRQDAGGYNG
jgi:hypothetical protein